MDAADLNLQSTSLDELSERVIGCCFEVHRRLGAGFLEKVYENALTIELRKHGISASQQAPISVHYDSEVVGEYFADLLIDGRLICELKAGEALAKQHEVQLVNYLTATGMDFGLLIHFGQSVTVRRKFRQRKSG